MHRLKTLLRAVPAALRALAVLLICAVRQVFEPQRRSRPARHRASPSGRRVVSRRVRDEEAARRYEETAVRFHRIGMDDSADKMLSLADHRRSR